MAKYLILKKLRSGRWEKTCWTDPDGNFPTPAKNKVAATRALKHAQRLYPEVEYKISDPIAS